MAVKKAAKKPPVKKSNSSNGSGSLEGETQSNILKIADIEEAQKAKRTTGERIAEFVADFCGSMTFVYVHIVFFGGWIGLNTTIYKFDPFPFTFLTLVVSLEAIFLSTFILISQNHETRLTERRNHLDLQINMLAEQESTKTLELLHRVAKKIGVKDDDLDGHHLLEPMDAEQLVEQIMSTADGKAGKQGD